MLGLDMGSGLLSRVALAILLLGGGSAHAEETPPDAPEDDEERELDDAPVPLSRSVGTATPAPGGPLLDAEVALGGSLFAGGLGASSQVELGVGLTPGLLNGRLRAGAVVGYARPRATGLYDDPALDAALDWSLRLHRVDAGLGLAASLSGDGADLDVEFIAVPRLSVFHAAGRTLLEGDPMGVGRETYLRPGVLLGAGVLGPVRGGELAAHLGVTLQRHEGALTGSTAWVTPSVLLRYRTTLFSRRS